MAFQHPLNRLLYACELASKLIANYLLLISSTTESVVDTRVRAISTRDTSLSLIVAGFFVLAGSSGFHGPKDSERKEAIRC
jgi:hypothetical protein